MYTIDNKELREWNQRAKVLRNKMAEKYIGSRCYVACKAASPLRYRGALINRPVPGSALRAGVRQSVPNRRYSRLHRDGGRKVFRPHVRSNTATMCGRSRQGFARQYPAVAYASTNKTLATMGYSRDKNFQKVVCRCSRSIGRVG